MDFASMNKYSNDKNINKEVRLLIKLKWTYRKGKKHGSLISPNGRKMAVPCTPSDHRAFYNFKRDVRYLISGGYYSVAR